VGAKISLLPIPIRSSKLRPSPVGGARTLQKCAREFCKQNPKGECPNTTKKRVILPDNISHPTAIQTFEHGQSLAQTLKKFVRSGEIHS
jgi:hypothetical protein